MTFSKDAYYLADEIRGGRWKHIADLATKPVPDYENIIRELERRCPGHSNEKYRDAIATGLFESR
jgi:hypothetical protein